MWSPAISFYHRGRVVSCGQWSARFDKEVSFLLVRPVHMWLLTWPPCGVGDAPTHPNRFADGQWEVDWTDLNWELSVLERNACARWVLRRWRESATCTDRLLYIHVHKSKKRKFSKLKLCVWQLISWSKAVFLNRRAAARYRALVSIIPARERFSSDW